MDLAIGGPIPTATGGMDTAGITVIPGVQAIMAGALATILAVPAAGPVREDHEAVRSVEAV